MHFGTRVIQGRDAKENVVVRLRVMRLLALGGVHQRTVGVQNCLGEARRTRREVDGSIVILGHLDVGVFGRAKADHTVIAVGKCGAVFTDVEHIRNGGQAIADLLHTADKLGTEHEHRAIRLAKTVFDLLGGIAIIQRDDDGARAQNTKIDGKPLNRIHQQNGNLVALFASARQQEIGKAVGLAVEIHPSDLATEGLTGLRLHQRVFAPGDAPLRVKLGVDLNQRDLVGIALGILRKHVNNRHRNSFAVDGDCPYIVKIIIIIS